MATETDLRCRLRDRRGVLYRALIGFALTPSDQPVSTLWPPNPEVSVEDFLAIVEPEDRVAEHARRELTIANASLRAEIEERTRIEVAGSLATGRSQPVP